jgi:hypothetical protein
MYIVNRKYYYSSLEQAIECAKQILRKRAYAPINEQFKITQGKKRGYCVALCDDWKKVGNSNLLRVIIQTVEIDKKIS